MQKCKLFSYSAVINHFLSIGDCNWQICALAHPENAELFIYRCYFHYTDIQRTERTHSYQPDWVHTDVKKSTATQDMSSPFRYAIIL